MVDWNVVRAAESWGVGSRLWYVIAALLLLLVASAGMASARPTMKETGGVAIVGMEFLWSSRRAREVLRAWGELGRAAARRSLWWDFPFVVAYAVGGTVVAGTIAGHAAVRGWDEWRFVAELCGYAVALAAALDVVENLALLLLLQRDGGQEDDNMLNLALLASLAAALKWTLGLAAVVVGSTAAVLFLAAT